MSEQSFKIYDSHAHLISDDEERYPRNPLPVSMDMLKGTPFGPGVMGIPGGVHGDKPLNLKPTAEQLLVAMEETGVVGITAVQKGLVYRTDNSYIVDAAAQYPEKMSAVIIIDPMEEKTLPMIRECSKRGVVGVRFFPMKVENKLAWLSSPQSVAVWELCNELGIVIDIEAPLTDPTANIPFISSMAERFPNMNVVLDHAFLPDPKKPNYGINEDYDLLVAQPNIYVKWTSINLDVLHLAGADATKVLRTLVDFFGADKVMWGSDIGTSSGTYKEMIERAHASMAELSESEKVKIFHDTGRRVFEKWEA